MNMKKSKKGEFIIIALFIIFTLNVSVITYFENHYIKHYTNIIQENIKDRLLVQGKVAAQLVPPEILSTFIEPQDMESPIYEEMLQKIRDYAEENDLLYVYYMRLVEDNIHQIILDSDPDPETHLGLDYFEEIDELTFIAYNGEPSCSMLGEYVEGWEGVLASYTPIFDDNGNVVAIVGVDISDEEIVRIRNLTQVFSYVFIIEISAMVLVSFLVVNLYSKKARDYNNASIAKSQFLSRMSHEIRTPMNAIIGFCRMAIKTEDIEKKNDYISNINSSSDYLLQLINSILDISKIEAGKMSLNIEKASLYKIIENIEKMMNSQVKSKNQNLTITISKDIPKYVYCDKMHLTQVIVNLTSNALKFTPENGEISINISLIEKKNSSCNLQFVIKDSGIGIDNQYIAKLFEPFEQGDGGITRKYGGTGLGLSISKLLIEMMDGNISVTSTVGKGSTFTFNVWLDIVSKEDEINEEEIKEATIEETINCKGMTFLVVEDNEINQLIAKNVLEDFGAIIEIANNGKEGVEMFTQNPDKYDIIFMDIQMPIMDGFEATKIIRQSNIKNAETVPIIAMTAEVFKEDIDHAIESGMNAHVGKPFKISEIVTAIRDSIY